MYRIISRPPPRDDLPNDDTLQDNAGNHPDESGGEEAEEAPSVFEGSSNERETSVLSVLSAPDSEAPQSASASEIQVLLFGRAACRLLSCLRSRRHNRRTLALRP